jgi:hypothetical protein
MFQQLRETGILLGPERHISVARTAPDDTFVTERNLGKVSGRARHESASDRTCTGTASPPRLSSCGLELLTVEHQALMIVSASISLGNFEVKRHPLQVFPRALSFTHSAASLCHFQERQPVVPSPAVSLNRVGALLIRSRNAAIIRVTVNPVRRFSCTHTLATFSNCRCQQYRQYSSVPTCALTSRLCRACWAVLWKIKLILGAYFVKVRWLSPTLTAERRPPWPSTRQTCTR